MAQTTAIQHRRDTAANWTSTNPTLDVGEFGYETDTGYVKIGDGSTQWSSLGYIYAGATATPGIDDVVGVNQALTSDATINLGGNDWIFSQQSGFTTTIDYDGTLSTTQSAFNIEQNNGSQLQLGGGALTWTPNPAITTSPIGLILKGTNLNSSSVTFSEQLTNGSNTVRVTAPSAIGSNVAQILQDRAGDIALTDLPTAASDPTGISAGYQYFNTTDNVVKAYTGSTWITFLAGTGIELLTGTGTPESSETADIGALYIDDSTGDVYTKQEDGTNTGWSKLAIEVNLGTLTTEVIGANQNNWNPTDLARGTVLVNPSTVDILLTGIVAQSNGFLLTIVNVGAAKKITFVKEDSASTAANRLGGASSKVILSAEAAQFIYSTSLSRWIKVV